MTILIINLAKEPMHYDEFVRPIEDILKGIGVAFKTVCIQKLNQKDLQADKIIIAGTSLMDNEYLNYKDKFEFIKTFDTPILGICAGMQIISLVFGGKLTKKQEIGLIDVEFKKEFLGVRGKRSVYALHNNRPTVPKGFISCASSTCPQAIKHKVREIYGTLFHPEVRNKDIIESFTK